MCARPPPRQPQRAAAAHINDATGHLSRAGVPLSSRPPPAMTRRRKESVVLTWPWAQRSVPHTVNSSATAAPTPCGSSNAIPAGISTGATKPSVAWWVRLYRTRQRATALRFTVVHEVAPRHAKVAQSLHRTTVAVEVDAGVGGIVRVLAQIAVRLGVAPVATAGRRRRRARPRRRRGTRRPRGPRDTDGAWRPPGDREATMPGRRRRPCGRKARRTWRAAPPL